MEQIAELRYPVSGKPMVAEPINVPLQRLAALLREGQTVVAELEPGDATYYNLLIVPCWADTVHRYLESFGIPPGSASNYLLVVKLEQECSRAAWILTDGAVGRHDTVPLTNNPWSQELLAWWLSHLVEAMAPKEG